MLKSDSHILVGSISRVCSVHLTLVDLSGKQTLEVVDLVHRETGIVLNWGDFSREYHTMLMVRGCLGRKP